MLLLLKCFSFQPPYTIYTSFSSPTNRDVPGTLSIFISSYPRSVLVSFSSLLHNRWKGAWLLMMLEMDRAVKLREREALLLVCTRLAGSGICTQLAFPLDYSRLFTSFFFSFKEFSRLFFFPFPSEVERAFSAVQQPGTGGEICISPLHLFSSSSSFLDNNSLAAVYIENRKNVTDGWIIWRQADALRIVRIS